MFRRLLPCVFVTLLACASTADLLKFTNQGPIDLARRAEVQQRFAELKEAGTPGAPEVVVFQNNAPPGIALHGNLLSIGKGTPYVLLGSFSLNYRKLASLVKEPEAVADMQLIGRAAGANLVVCHMVTTSAGNVLGIEGFVIRKVELPSAARAPAPEPASAPLLAP